MSEQDTILKFFKASNALVINGMYLKEYTRPNELSLDCLKGYNPGHLGTSLSINFILANLYYFLHKMNLKSQIVIGTGHAGISLISNLWLNGTLEKNKMYPKTREGLNHLIRDFGTKIRSEINPEYPDTIYDGGELGYSLGVAYGYAIESEAQIVPCIIGDGEAETGTLSASWYLSKILNTKSKVLPILNLNGLKMGSKSILSRMSNEELTAYFSSLGYSVTIVDSSKGNIEESITAMQNAFTNSLDTLHPLIIFKSLKGYTLPVVKEHAYEGDISVHKNPLSSKEEVEKLEIIKEFLINYDDQIFDESGHLFPLFDSFTITTPSNMRKPLIKEELLPSNLNPDEYLAHFLSKNNGIVFSPDEIYSNQFSECATYSIEMLNENVLQAMYQGYTQAGNIGYFISYEGFMPILSSMITQYYKFLYQKESREDKTVKHSLNYLLTSTCLENTYSHQNPDFVNALFEKNDFFYNVLYPKDFNNVTRAIQFCQNTTDKINVITFSKRHKRVYQDIASTNLEIETIVASENPSLVLCATGDYMLDQVMEVYELLKENGISAKIVYVTKPQILSKNSCEALTEEEFRSYFNLDVPVVYLFSGYASAIKALLYGRKGDFTIRGYNDTPCPLGNFYNNVKSNGLSVCDIIDLCKDKLATKTLKLRREAK